VVCLGLVEYDVVDSGGPPLGEVVGALEQHVQHLVVGDQDVGAQAADLASGGGDVLVSGGGGVTDVQAGGDSGEGGVGQVVVEAVGLVGGQGGHGVEQDRLDAAFALGLGAAAVVQDRDEEGLGLAGAGAGGDEGGFGGLVQGGQAWEGLRVVQERGEAGRVPCQG